MRELENLEIPQIVGRKLFNHFEYRECSLFISHAAFVGGQNITSTRFIYGPLLRNEEKGLIMQSLQEVTDSVCHALCLQESD